MMKQCQEKLLADLFFASLVFKSGKRKKIHSQKGNNRTNFPKGPDTGIEINCSVVRLNNGVCGMIKESGEGTPSRPEPTHSKPIALTAQTNTAKRSERKHQFHPHTPP
jgi:hypothetical protein